MKEASKMSSKKYKIIIAVLVLIIILLSIRVIFDSKFDDFDRFVKTRQNYEGGTDKFDKDFQGLMDWEKEYRQAHPDASDEDVDKAFKAAWGK